MSVRCNDGRYTVDYYPHGAHGKRVRMRLPPGTTEQTALQIERDIVRTKKDQPFTSINDNIACLIKQYYDHINMHLAPATCKDIKSCFSNHVIPYFGRMLISDISTPLVSAYQKHRIDKPYIRKGIQKAINRTINKELAYFSGFLKWLKREVGVINLSPIDVRSLPYKRPLPNILSREEVDAIIKASEDRYRGIILAISHLGLRINSARELKWNDVDWQTKSIRAYLKGRREIILPLSDDMYKWLKTAQKNNIYDSPWLFPSRSRPMHPIVDVRKALNRACTKAGITKRVHPHLFRHCAAAHLIESGVDIRTVQELLGHSDIRMTQHYTQIAMKTKKNALIKMGRIIVKKT